MVILMILIILLMCVLCILMCVCENGININVLLY